MEQPIHNQQLHPPIAAPQQPNNKIPKALRRLLDYNEPGLAEDHERPRRGGSDKQ